MLYFCPKFFSGRTGGIVLMKSGMVILVMLLVFSCGGDSFAQLPTYEINSGLDLNWIGSGARARAMGGAYLSIVDDASALTWNPAGLIQTLDPQVSFSAGYNNPNSTYEGTGLGSGGAFSMDRNVWGLSYASFLAPIRIGGHQVSASVAYQRISEAAFARQVQLIEIEDVSTYITETAEGGLNVVNLGFGTDVYKSLAFGVAANIYFGSAEERRDLTEDFITTVGSGQSAYEGRFLTRAHWLNEVTYNGFNLTLGFHYKADKLRLAVVGRTPFNLVRKFDVLQADTLFTGRVGYALRQDDQFTQPLFIFVDQKEKIEMPLTLAGGASYKVSDQLLVSADLEWRRFGKSNVAVLDSGLIRSSGEREEFFTDHYLHLFNSGEARLGFEYTITSESGSYPLRGGFRYVQQYSRNVDSLWYSIYRDNNQALNTLTWEFYGDDKISGYAFTVGGGAHWERIWLDAAFEYYADDRDISVLTYAGYTDDKDKFTRSRVTLNFTGFF